MVPLWLIVRWERSFNSKAINENKFKNSWSTKMASSLTRRLSRWDLLSQPLNVRCIDYFLIGSRFLNAANHDPGYYHARKWKTDRNCRPSHQAVHSVYAISCLRLSWLLRAMTHACIALSRDVVLKAFYDTLDRDTKDSEFWEEILYGQEHIEFGLKITIHMPYSVWNDDLRKPDLVVLFAQLSFFSRVCGRVYHVQDRPSLQNHLKYIFSAHKSSLCLFSSRPSTSTRNWNGMCGSSPRDRLSWPKSSTPLTLAPLQ